MTLKSVLFKLYALCIVLLLLAGVAVLPWIIPSFPASEEAAEVGSFPVEFDLGGLSLDAESAILIDMDSGSVLYAKNPDEKRGMASTTKIMTAYAVLSCLPVDKVVEITPEMTGAEGSSLYLKAGEKLTVKELLYGLLLESGNDSAVALAMACDGSVEAFAERMNKTAKELGLKSTRFANPHGLSAEGISPLQGSLRSSRQRRLKTKPLRRSLPPIRPAFPITGSRTEDISPITIPC